MRGLLSATKVEKLSCGWVFGREIILGVVYAVAMTLVFSEQQVIDVCRKLPANVSDVTVTY